MEQESQESHTLYELAVLLRGADDEPGFSSYLGGAGVKADERGSFAPIKLAYPIQKHESACFGWYRFTADPETVKRLGHDLKLRSEVVRFLLVKAPVKSRGRLVGQRRAAEPKTTPNPQALTNEALEETLEEISK